MQRIYEDKGGYMNWQDVCADHSLQDLPYKIELNQRGKIEMSPAKNDHSFKQWRIQKQIDRLSREGEILPECPIQTEDNVKVADVVWISDERAQIIKKEVVSSIAPEICIEIMSEFNDMTEMMFKKDLYLKAGAQEFWLCDLNGNMSFYDQTGKITKSQRFPDFPDYITI